MNIYREMGWLAPGIIAVAQGERSFCNWDEDSLTMAVAAARDCLLGHDKNAVDGLFLCSTTLPFADRLNAGIVKTALNLRDDLQAADFSSSLRAGSTGLVNALSMVRSGDKHNILVAASDKRETRMANNYEMWFGDGAASLLVGDKNVIAEYIGSYTVTYDFIDHYRAWDMKFDYVWEERWLRTEGYGKIIPEAVAGLFKKLSISMEDVDKLVFPCFIKAEHRRLAKMLGASPEKVIDNMHEVCGETGTAHPLLMLVNALENANPSDRILVAGFGQGCDALYFRVTDAIKSLPERKGVRGSLANRKTVEQYLKFLKFRDLIQTEMGIRAEGPTTTAMTVLWRNRDMLLGLVGGKCTACGTPQFPRADICVNPDCKAVETQVPHEFADEPAFIKSFTGDNLSVSMDPPNVYGMVQFKNGGRFMADFTDCELSEVRVGQPVSFSFRKRYEDEKRGFTGYFWKAIPHQDIGVDKIEEIRFDDQVVVITGAGAGLGRAYALEFARRGARVVVNDLGGARDGTGEASQLAADKVVEEIKALGGEAVASYDSVTTPEGGQAIVDTTVDAFGRLDVLVNNAGILRDRSLVKMEAENWDAVLDVHLKGAFNVTRPAFTKMRENGYGRIILTTSGAGLYGNFGQINYSSAKMGLVGFMNTLKLEGEKHNIKVNTVAPVAGTRLTEDVFPPDLFKNLKPEQVAPLVLYLCSKGCEENGMIFNGGMGYFNRVAILTGPGFVVEDEVTELTPEGVAVNMDKIKSLDNAMEFPNAQASAGPMMQALGRKKRKK
jgi:3-hydroxy-3-methylglutaryl CoA synthase/NAD(P)-dependent dehydrogenase (short-subunit alcohol dehydrogenase family)